MAKGRGDEPYKLRNSRWKTLITLLYHKGLKRPEPNRVATSPSELTKLTGLGKVHLTIDNLKFLEDMGYIKDVKCRYGSVALIIVTDLIAAKDSPETTQVASGSPSDSAVSGGHNNHSSFLISEGETICQEKQQELVVEDQKKHSEKSSTNSINQVKQKSRLRLRSTSE